MSDKTYNGWTNYETWNVALWVGNDEGLYRMAREYRDSDTPYADFVAALSELGSTKTGDGVAWDDPALDLDELDDMMKEL